MTKEEFANLTPTEQNWVIYQLFADSETSAGESPIAGLFNPDKPRAVPVHTTRKGPEGFELIFGPYPSHLPYGAAQRSEWENKVKRWGGLYNLENLPKYNDNVFIANQNELGNPIAYVFDGDVFVTFTKFAENGVRWYRDLSQYINNYQALVNAAKHEAFIKGLRF